MYKPQTSENLRTEQWDVVRICDFYQTEQKSNCGVCFTSASTADSPVWMITRISFGHLLPQILFLSCFPAFAGLVSILLLFPALSFS